MNTRRIDKILDSRPTSDGDGVKIRRTLGVHRHDLDPFLMIDEIRADEAADYVGGFPPHPHRGIETFTLMFEGGFEHRDHLGHQEALRDGGAQWMSTGRGVIHSEMPLAQEGRLHGFQLWVNLPAAQKMKAPEYAQADAAALPVRELSGGVRAKVFGGRWQLQGEDVVSPLDRLAAGARVLELTLPGEAEVRLPTPAEDAVLVYVIDGSLQDGAPVRAGQTAIYGAGAELALSAGPAGARLLVLAGTPLGEPIAHHGPFVMNTEEEIRQAIADYRNGTLAQPAA
jgi:hypothetical protein